MYTMYVLGLPQPLGVWPLGPHHGMSDVSGYELRSVEHLSLPSNDSPPNMTHGSHVFEDSMAHVEVLDEIPLTHGVLSKFTLLTHVRFYSPNSSQENNLKTDFVAFKDRQGKRKAILSAVSSLDGFTLYFGNNNISCQTAFADIGLGYMSWVFVGMFSVWL